MRVQAPISEAPCNISSHLQSSPAHLQLSPGVSRVQTNPFLNIGRYPHMARCPVGHHLQVSQASYCTGEPMGKSVARVSGVARVAIPVLLLLGRGMRPQFPPGASGSPPSTLDGWRSWPDALRVLIRQVARSIPPLGHASLHVEPTVRNVQ